MNGSALVEDFQALLPSLEVDPLSLVRAALVVAKIEFPDLEPGATIDRLQDLGDRARGRLEGLRDAPIRARLTELGRLIYQEERFSGNRSYYGDFRNSLLNVVVERRLGIPISLGLVYAQVARLAGLEVFGVSFPGHFLLRVPDDAGRESGEPVILDPFDGGRELDEDGCRALLERHAGDTAEFSRSLLTPCTARQWLARMLNNLKRTYVEQRSFPHARLISELSYLVEPTVGASLRDRGLLAYHLDDFPAALRDLERYLRLRQWHEDDRDERDRVLEHVKTLRGRVASLN